MRFPALCVSILALAGLAFPARAQSPLEGPLSSPAPAAKPAPAHPKTNPHNIGSKKARAATGDARSDHAPRAVPAAAAAPQSRDPTGPVSLGMKWNGNNDNPVQTRTQNYGGDAQGAGAEVGLKLHF